MHHVNNDPVPACRRQAAVRAADMQAFEREPPQLHARTVRKSRCGCVPFGREMKRKQRHTSVKTDIILALAELPISNTELCHRSATSSDNAVEARARIENPSIELIHESRAAI
ncbi:MAG: hypothetical protein ACLUZX_12200 [Subdoligranulum sp.]